MASGELGGFLTDQGAHAASDEAGAHAGRIESRFVGAREQDLEVAAALLDVELPPRPVEPSWYHNDAVRQEYAAACEDWYWRSKALVEEVYCERTGVSEWDLSKYATMFKGNAEAGRGR